MKINDLSATEKTNPILSRRSLWRSRIKPNLSRRSASEDGFQTLGWDGLTDKGLVHLRNMKKLYHLSLKGKFTDKGLRHLEEFKFIGYLSIESEDDFSDKALYQLVKSLPNLRKLKVNGGNLQF